MSNCCKNCGSLERLADPLLGAEASASAGAYCGSCGATWGRVVRPERPADHRLQKLRYTTRTPVPSTPAEVTRPGRPNAPLLSGFVDVAGAAPKAAVIRYRPNRVQPHAKVAHLPDPKARAVND